MAARGRARGLGTPRVSSLCLLACLVLHGCGAHGEHGAHTENGRNGEPGDEHQPAAGLALDGSGGAGGAFIASLAAGEPARDDAADDDPAPAPRPADTLPWPDDAPPMHKGLWVGSWAPTAENGFDEQWVDEPAVRKVLTKDRAGRRAWAGAGGGGGVFPIDLLVRDRQGPAVAYVYSLLSRSSETDDPWAEDAFPDRPATLHLRHRGRVQLRIDGELVLDLPPPEDGDWGQAQAAVTLTGPYDVLLLKLGRGSEELGPALAFELRVSDADGQPIPGQGWNSMRPPSLPSDLED